MWKPTYIKRFIGVFPTSTNAMRVDTDAGEGFLKALGNPEGPHTLACELVGTMLAEWMGLPTLEYAVIAITTEDELPFASGGNALPGPAFITKAVEGAAWGGESRILATVPRQALARLVVLDTWIRNCDRYRPKPAFRVNYDNVFLTPAVPPGTGNTLVAIDHTHTFTCGRELTQDIGHIDTIQDTTIYGLFPEFRPFISRAAIEEARKHVATMSIEQAAQFVSCVPPEWGVGKEVRTAWSKFIWMRARFLATHMENWL